MDQRHWLNIVKPYVQLKFLVLVLFTVLANVAVLGAFAWYVVDYLVRETSIESDVWQSIVGDFFFGGIISGLVALGITLLAVYFLLRELNRVVGPIYRVSQELDYIHETGDVHPISVRSDDYFQSMVKKLNLVLLDLSQD